MQCPTCQSDNPSDAAFCVECGHDFSRKVENQPPTPPNGHYSKPINNFMIPAILSLFCCMPFGIAAIIYASQVNPKAQSGDHAGAMESSKKAKLWVLVSIGGAFLAYAVYFIFAIIASGNF